MILRLMSSTVKLSLARYCKRLEKSAKAKASISSKVADTGCSKLFLAIKRRISSAGPDPKVRNEKSCLLPCNKLVSLS